MDNARLSVANELSGSLARNLCGFEVSYGSALEPDGIATGERVTRYRTFSAEAAWLVVDHDSLRSSIRCGR